MVISVLAFWAVTVGSMQGSAVMRPEEFGARGDGQTDDGPAFATMFDRINAQGGKVEVIGDPSKRYRINRDLTIKVSNVNLDFKGAMLLGTGRIEFKGGGWDRMLTNVFMRNAKLGDGSVQTSPRGPRFDYCQDSGAEKIDKNGFTGTAFNGYFCKRLFFRDIDNRLARSNGETIGFLLFFCDDSVIERTVLRDGTFIFGWQIKGGRGNVVRDSRSLNVTPGGALTIKAPSTEVSPGDSVRGDRSGATARVVLYDAGRRELKIEHQDGQFRKGEVVRIGGRAEAVIAEQPEFRSPRVAFYDRGDAPYKSSNSKNTELPYPFPDGSYDVPDKRRESIDSRYENCSTDASDSWQVSFLSQEARGTQFVNCRPGAKGKGIVTQKIGGSTFMSASLDAGQDIRVGDQIVGQRSGAKAVVVQVAVLADGTRTLYLAESPALIARGVKRASVRPNTRIEGGRSGAVAKVVQVVEEDEEEPGSRDVLVVQILQGSFESGEGLMMKGSEVGTIDVQVASGVVGAFVPGEALLVNGSTVGKALSGQKRAGPDEA